MEVVLDVWHMGAQKPTVGANLIAAKRNGPRFFDVLFDEIEGSFGGILKPC